MTLDERYRKSHEAGSIRNYKSKEINIRGNKFSVYFNQDKSDNLYIICFDKNPVFSSYLYSEAINKYNSYESK